MSRRMEVPRCPQCGVHATHVIVEETAKAVAFMRCDPCGLAAHRRLIADANGNMWQWDRATLWVLREQAERVYRVLCKARQEAQAETRDIARKVVNAMLSQWLGRADLGPWTSWSEHDCRVILANANPFLISYADALVTGGDRLTLHAAAAKKSAFPRLTMARLLTRDRVRDRGRAMAQRVLGWVARFRGVSTSDER